MTNWILPSAIFTVIVPLTAGYLIGSVPIGLVVVRLSTGKNVLNEHSGRTGGTNVMRTAGFWAGLVTAIGDVLKGGAAVLLAQALAPGAPWVQAGAGILAVLGHNHSVFLMDRSQGRLRFRGGAGGATAVGCGIALSPALAWVIPVVPILLFGIGYASVATLSVGALMTLTLAVQANAGHVPWERSRVIGCSVAPGALEFQRGALRRGAGAPGWGEAPTTSGFPPPPQTRQRPTAPGRRWLERPG